MNSGDRTRSATTCSTVPPFSKVAHEAGAGGRVGGVAQDLLVQAIDQDAQPFRRADDGGRDGRLAHGAAVEGVDERPRVAGIVQVAGPSQGVVEQDGDEGGVAAETVRRVERGAGKGVAQVVAAQAAQAAAAQVDAVVGSAGLQDVDGQLVVVELVALHLHVDGGGLADAGRGDQARAGAVGVDRCPGRRRWSWSAFAVWTPPKTATPAAAPPVRLMKLPKIWCPACPVPGGCP